MSNKRGGGSIILATFLVGFMLSQMPLPQFAEWFRPEWVVMILIYWVMALPERVGLGTATAVGLVLDLIKGSPLGLNVLTLLIICYLTQILYKRLRMFPLVQQAIMVMVLVGINQLVFNWVHGLMGSRSDSLIFLLPALVSALLWPWLFVILRSLRRTFRVG
ncbi:rod shape-determining protein MreD [Amphritea balenae]|uniref:Rod shape-determining protein MreD n=1 Tax=Amphritea balenae TaxID=452629 RepID=A0A3P1SMQ6_9GAMM|nr:rod shape-determining protein MreD [Amphritea balenae]RRC98310.1 rod shape-determining protein MreD [Amphritea balenae]GGK80851.1 rod shape-determining protein MreD [Amphritea balenae]